MFLFEVESGAKAHRANATSSLIDTNFFEGGNQIITLLCRLAIKGEIGALTAHVGDSIGIFLRESV